MGKIKLVIAREFMTRVKSKQFIIATIVGPLLMSLIVVVPILIKKHSGVQKQTVIVLDKSKIFHEKIKGEKNLSFQFSNESEEKLTATIKGEKNIGLLIIPENINVDEPKGINYISEEAPGFNTLNIIENSLSKELENLKLTNSGFSRTFIDSIRIAKVNVNTKNIEKENTSVGMASWLGIAGGMIMYFFIFIYGMMVMRGVVEEKANRIVEVIVSSVKPFQLMMGKIIGIATVGLFQVFLWVVLGFGIIGVVLPAIGFDTNSMDSRTEIITQNLDDKSKAAMQEIQNQEGEKNGFLKAIESLTWQRMVYLILMFVFFFLGGYLLYASLFAAIGSAVDNETDTQQLIFPVTIPIILSIIVAQFVIQDPNSSISFWFSIIPLFSPIVMMVRLPFDPPTLEIILSMVLLVLGFLGTTWLAAKIYRTGILMYGKKPSFKEMGKWLFYKS